ncbi:MAG: peptidyl-prolyl cis-trans isomerase [Acidobacteriota bacterium]|jgi:parvulin-like peptidyl-prolyl isomerase
MRAWRIGVAMALLGAFPASAEIIEEIVANVNGEIITKTEVEQREREIQQALFSNLSGAELEKAVAENRKMLLVDMINSMLLFQRAKRLGLDMDQVYESNVDSIKAQNNIKTNEEFYDLLKRQGMTKEEFRDGLLKYNVPDIMINIEVRQAISVSPEEAQAYYDANPDRFAHPTTYTFREIAILLDDHSREEALGIAREVIAKAAAGDAFEDLVEQYSEAPSAERGGLLEGLPVDELSAAVLDGLKPLEPGQVSDPVETTRAVFVLQLVERVDAHRDDLETVLPDVEIALKRQKYQKALDDYLTGLWKDNWICVFPKYAEKYPIDRYGEPNLCS